MPNSMDGNKWRLLDAPRHHLWVLFGLMVTTSCILPVGRRAMPQHSWRRDQGPVVPHDTFPSDCTLCHEGDTWHKLRDDFHFDHGRETGLTLFGAHKQAQCLRCHNDRGSAGVFAKRGCSGCHEDIHRGQLGNQCILCHNQNNWLPEGQFALHNQTRFPLVGAHTAVACFRCHPGAQVGNFKRAPVECEACHQADLQRATAPNHLALGWTQDCQRCHQPTVWGSGGFNHSNFPLTGAHIAVDCDLCHTNGVFSGLSHACNSCHMDDFTMTTNPDHVADGFPTMCEACHNTTSWQGAMFTHAGITTGCSACHMDDFTMTTNPDHVADGFPTACENCHNTSTWLGAMFNHTGITTGCATCHIDEFNMTTNPDHVADGFPPNCEICHNNTNTWLGAVFNHATTTAGCSACHIDEYNMTTNPSHMAEGFPTTCESCHNTNTWLGAMFNHTGVTTGCSTCHINDFNMTTNPNHVADGFPTNCESCHGTNTWLGAIFNHAGITTGCATCHTDEFNMTTNPNHVTEGFPTNCEACHSTNTWLGAMFNHAGITTGCATCHIDDFNMANNPNHISQGFPTSCEMCHNTNMWTGTFFNHSFPINNGAHKQLLCTDCHLIPTNFNVASCTHCHEHRQPKMDDKHSGVNNYMWISSACINCHPNGKN